MIDHPNTRSIPPMKSDAEQLKEELYLDYLSMTNERVREQYRRKLKKHERKERKKRNYGL